MSIPSANENPLRNAIGADLVGGVTPVTETVTQGGSPLPAPTGAGGNPSGRVPAPVGVGKKRKRRKKSEFQKLRTRLVLSVEACAELCALDRQPVAVPVRELSP